MELIDIYDLKEGCDSGLIKKIPIITDQVMVTVLYVGPRHEIPFHIHSNYDEVHYVTEGSGEITIEGMGRLVKEGNLILVPRGKKHRFRGGENGSSLLTINPLSGCIMADKIINM